jgi:hypothetical protein
VDKTPATTQPNVHDETLIDWFLSLDPGERLAELESRLAFFASVRRDDHLQLRSNTRAPRVLPLRALIDEKKALGREKDLAVVNLLETVLRRSQ